MGFARFLNFQEEVYDLLMLRQSFFGRQLEKVFDLRHVNPGSVRGAPVGAGVGRHYVFAVHLGQGRFVYHKLSLGRGAEISTAQERTSAEAGAPVNHSKARLRAGRSGP